MNRSSTLRLVLFTLFTLFGLSSFAQQNLRSIAFIPRHFTFRALTMVLIPFLFQKTLILLIQETIRFNGKKSQKTLFTCAFWFFHLSKTKLFCITK